MSKPKFKLTPPFDSGLLDFLQASVSPSGVYNCDNWTFRYFVDKLYQRAVGQIIIDGLPMSWDQDYIKAALIGGGRLAVFRVPDRPEWGPIGQYFQWGPELNIWYRPKYVMITNAALPSNVYTLEIGKDCEILHLDPLYHGLISIVWHYAESLALTWEAAVMNTQNSKLAYLLLSDRKAMTKALEAIFDKIMGGQPAVVWEDVSGKLGNIKDHITTFSQDLRANYVAPEMIRNFRAIMNAFDAEVGIPFANSEKRERMTSDEVNIYNVESQALVRAWIDTLNRDAEKVAKMFPDLQLRFSLREVPEEGGDNGTDGNVSGPVRLG